MKWPSKSLFINSLLMVYMAYLVYRLSLSFVLPSCDQAQDCLRSILLTKPQLELQIYSSATSYPVGLDLLHHEKVFDYSKAHWIEVSLPIYKDLSENGTIFFHVIMMSPEVIKYPGTYYEMNQKPIVHYATIEMTHYAVPEVSLLDILSDEKKSSKSMERLNEPISHLISQLNLMMITDNIKLPAHNLPPDLAGAIRVVKDRMFIPNLIYNYPQTWHRDLVKIPSPNEAINVMIYYTPISIGKFRLIMNSKNILRLAALGFSHQDADEIGGIFADTDPYLLGGIFFIIVMHFLFKFLTFQYDTTFWRRREILSGSSARIVLWHAFSEAVVLLYLLNERCSMFVLIPTFVETINLFRKSKKCLKLKLITDQGWLPRIEFQKTESTSDEDKIDKYHTKIMILSRLLYLLVVGGAVHSLLYQQHKSWYSWGIRSLVNGVYVFDFLFMFPPLLINHELKSVPYVPWRAMIYKSLTIVIHNILAFVIPMPTPYRVASFRDDAVFLIEIYQRWLYPVDKSHRDDAVPTDEAPPTSHEMHDKKE